MSRSYRQNRYDVRPRKRREEPRCKAKRRYSDQVTARAAALITMRDVGNRDRLWTYKCPHCFGWHLTHKNEGRRMLVTAESPEVEPVAD